METSQLKTGSFRTENFLRKIINSVSARKISKISILKILKVCQSLRFSINRFWAASKSNLNKYNLLGTRISSSTNPKSKKQNPKIMKSPFVSYLDFNPNSGKSVKSLVKYLTHQPCSMISIWISLIGQKIINSQSVWVTVYTFGMHPIPK